MKTRAFMGLIAMGSGILLLAIFSFAKGQMSTLSLWWAFFGTACVTIGIAHFISDEGVSRAEKLMKLFPRPFKKEEKRDNLVIE